MAFEDKYIGFPPEIRLTHLIHLVAFFGLALSGFFIHNPLGLGALAAVKWVRFTHTVSAIFFYATFVFRLYYAFGTGDYVNFKLLPEDLPQAKEWLKYYFFLRPEKPVQRKYNPLQKFTYYTLITLLLLQAASGLGLYFKHDFPWVLAIMAGLQSVRTLHFFVAVILTAIVGLHFYLTLTAADQRLRKSMFALGRIRSRD